MGGTPIAYIPDMLFGSMKSMHFSDMGGLMATYNKDEVEGKFEKGKGWVKDKAGEVMGDRSLEAEGEADRAAGETQETWGKFKRGVSDTVDSVGDAIDDAADRINR
jgi:uncharacterized protein YjbJ (UPF0337 family)